MSEAIGHPAIGNLAISASAGSGKTFRLAHRYIRLLAMGVDPARIAALTFSRKAAGEIFDSIVGYLVKAASSDQAAANLAKNAEVETLSQAQCLALLRSLFESLHRLKIGTLDGFAVSLLVTFAMELGIGPDPAIYDSQGGEGMMVRRAVLDQVFRRGGLPDEALAGFVDAFRQATFGREERRLFELLDEFVSRFHEVFLLVPGADFWGDPDRIWPEGAAFWRKTLPPLVETCDRLATLSASLPKEAARRWLEFVETARAFNPAAPIERPLSYFFEKAGPELAALAAGSAVIPIGRARIAVEGELARLTRDLMGLVMRAEFEAACRRTAGIHRVLALYEELYDRHVRGRGQLTFTDVQHLLGPANPHAPGRMLSSRGGEARLAIDYRLDGRLDHWLLDEFQDTSDLQWLVLENLIDEVLQDDSGERSFFYVGDVKQAIYGWRSGNAALFGAILERYREVIDEEPLDLSFRSRPAVIDLVNQVFGDLPGELPAATADAWARIWRDHQSAPHLAGEPGYAAILEPDAREGDKPDRLDRHLLVAAILRELDPRRANLSVAVLVRGNDQGRELVEVLRRECPGLSVAHEGVARIDDNPVVSLLLAVLRLAAHPGDSFASRQIEMSPLAHAVGATGLARGRFCRRVLGAVQEKGFRETLAIWGRKLDQAQPLDAFGRKRLDDLLAAASRFDAAGSRDINAFLLFIANYSRKEEAAAGVVRVMTVHQAKGLGFDVVLLPELQGKSMDSATGRELLRVRAAGGAVCLSMPRKIIAQADPVLSSALADDEAIAAFDELCVLYVALTRAKQALYCITSHQGKTSTSFTPAALIKTQTRGEAQPAPLRREAFAGVGVDLVFETGDQGWRQAIVAKAAETDIAPPEALAAIPAAPIRLRPLAPSAAADHVRPAAALFEPPAGHGMAFGSAVHSLFERLSWLGEEDLEQLAVDFRRQAGLPENFASQAVRHFEAAIASPEIRAALCRPEGRVTLWRERAFDVVLDGDWVSGVFDRVALEHDETGAVRRATVLDYKSNLLAEGELAGAVDGYRPQMLLYRRAVAALCGIAPDQVDLLLVFSSLGRVARV